MLATMAMDGFLAMCEWLWLWIFGAHCQRMLLTSCRQAGSRQKAASMRFMRAKWWERAASSYQVASFPSAPVCVSVCMCVACGLTRSRTGTATAAGTATVTGTVTGTGRIVIIICASGIGLFMGLWVRQRRFVTNRFTGKSQICLPACHKSAACCILHAACSHDAA